jgi:biopolymer transport protein ExbB/biopolymer transport protein TolQ
VEFGFRASLQHFTAFTWGITICLTLMSVLSFAVAVNRLIYFVRARKQSLAFAGAVSGALKKQDIASALKRSADELFKFSYLARIVATALTDALDTKEKAGSLDDLSTVGSAMDRTVAQEAEGLRKWLTILATVASTAPFVGLLGTVIGIINSFKGMAANESAGIAAVAGGIAEALYMTGYGLLVAIPAVWLYNWANANIEGFEVEMVNSASEMLDWVKKNRTAI